MPVRSWSARDAVRTSPLGKDYLGVPSNEVLGDFRDQARAAGEHMERYGPDRIGQTLRRDPAGTALDVGGLAVPGAAAGARAATMATKFGRHIADVDPPPPKMQTPTDREFIEGAPSQDALRGHADMLYTAAENAGLRFPSSTYTPFVDKLSTTLMREGLDDVLYPKVARINRIMSESVDKNPSLMDMETLRRQFGDAAKSPDPAERRLAQIGIDAVDDFVEAVDGASSGVLKEARSTYRKNRQSEMIQTAIEKATTAQQGFEAGLRAEFKSLYRAYLDKKKNMRGVSPELAKALKEVAEGNITSNTLRRIASLSGGSGPQRAMQNLLQGGAVGGGLGFAAAGPAGAAVGAAMAPLAGQLAGRGATHLTKRRADMARSIAARGETPEQAAVPTARSGRAPRAAAMSALPLAALLAGTERRGR